MQCSGCGARTSLHIATPDGQQHGPYAPAAVRQYVAEGRIDVNASASLGGEAWRPLHEVLGRLGVPVEAAVQAPAGFVPVELAPGISIDQLRAAAKFHELRSTLRGGAIGSLIFGALAIGVGGIAAGEDAIGGALLLLGLLLFANGVWIIAAPSAIGFVSNGIALMLVGLFNGGTAVLQLIGGEGGSYFWLILGGLQVFWGLQDIRRYSSFAGTARPPEDVLQTAGQIITTVEKAGPADRPDVIEMHLYVPGQKETPEIVSVRALLGADVVAVFALRTRKTTFAAPAEVQIAPAMVGGLGQGVPVTVSIPGAVAQTTQATMDPWAYQRYTQWAAAIAPDTAAT